MSTPTNIAAVEAEARLLVDDPLAAPEWLLDLIHTTGINVRLRSRAAGHPSLSASVVFQQILTGAPGSDFLLACTTCQDVLDLYADTDEPLKRCMVAFNPATSPVTLERLATDRDYRVRINAGLNGSLSTATRVRLALHDDDDRVRAEVHWAMTTANGRDILDGARYAVTSDEQVCGQDAVESRVLAWGG